MSKYDKDAQREWLCDAETEWDVVARGAETEWEHDRAEEFPSTVLLFAAIVAVCVASWALLNGIADWFAGFPV